MNNRHRRVAKLRKQELNGDIIEIWEINKAEQVSVLSSLLVLARF